MKRLIPFLLIFAASAVWSDCGDYRAAEKFAKEYFTAGTRIPFSFEYEGGRSYCFLREWTRTAAPGVVTYKNDEGLTARCEYTLYKDSPTVEWTVYLKNEGKKNSGRIKNLTGIDEYFTAEGDVRLLRAGHELQYVEKDLAKGEKVVLEPVGGRCTNGESPYYSLDFGESGVTVVAGWEGQWQSLFERGRDNVHVRIGQKTTDFYLLPGEEVRTPRIVVQFRKGGDAFDGVNLWRKWMLAHNMPRTKDGKVVPPQIAATASRVYNEMMFANEENQKSGIDDYLNNGLAIDYWWMDIGWYTPSFIDGHWITGSWDTDMTKFPKGLKAIDDYAHSRGMKGTIVWFQPEEVWPDTPFYERQEFFLSVREDQKDTINQYQRIGGRKLVDFGNPKAVEYIFKATADAISREHIDIYREDYNIEPLIFWENADEPDRQGITENKYVVGHLKFWDDLLKKFPGLIIDTCASGGRRNDLDTLKRSVPLWRTDSAFNTLVTQTQTYGCSMWAPFTGTGTYVLDSYNFRSNMTPGICSNTPPAGADFEQWRKDFKDWKLVSKYYYDDYYPLTECTADEKSWCSWQFGTAKEGVIQAFRRSECEESSMTLKIRGLNPKSEYAFIDRDSEEIRYISGKEAGEKGVEFTLTDKPGSAIVFYKETK
ncbi:MAG: alpha-galactosidase [Abditibacteriota bacterium]|nr:alpha-galactosidase [Abditibacteriota bacterium]